jgi:hypothetical protein
MADNDNDARINFVRSSSAKEWILLAASMEGSPLGAFESRSVSRRSSSTGYFCLTSSRVNPSQAPRPISLMSGSIRKAACAGAAKAIARAVSTARSSGLETRKSIEPG